MERAPLPAFDDLWDYNDPAATEARFRELLPTARSSGDQSYLAELLTQVARAQGLQRHFTEAQATLDEAETLLAGASPRARIRYLLERGRVFNSSGRREEASPLFVEALDLARAKAEDFYAVDAAHMLGICEPRERRLDWNLRALDMAESSADPHARKWVGSLYNNIGWTYHDLGRYEEALDLFRKGVAWHEAHGSLPELLIARWTVARCLRSLGRLDEALSEQLALLEERRKSGDEGGYVYEEVGECLLALGRPTEARSYFGSAYRLLSKDQWLSAQEPERLERLRVLSVESPHIPD